MRGMHPPNVSSTGRLNVTAKNPLKTSQVAWNSPGPIRETCHWRAMEGNSPLLEAIGFVQRYWDLRRDYFWLWRSRYHFVGDSGVIRGTNTVSRGRRNRFTPVAAIKLISLGPERLSNLRLDGATAGQVYVRTHVEISRSRANERTNFAA